MGARVNAEERPAAGTEETANAAVADYLREDGRSPI